MASKRVLNTFAMRKQHLLVELCVSLQSKRCKLTKDSSSGLKNACPEGIYMSLSPGDPTLWAGVMFVRRGGLVGYS
jgi:hypothetical protein